MRFFVIVLSLLFCCPQIKAEEIQSKASQAFLKARNVDGYYVSRVLSSVRVGDGGGCSGTVVFVGDWQGTEAAFGLSANHCGYSVNDTFTVWFVDGSSTAARCIDKDPNSDLMLFVMNPQKVLGVAPFPKKATTEDCYAVGFPNGKGPNQKALAFRKTWEMGEAGSNRDFIRNQWYVKPGNNAHHAAGDSGGGIFNGDNFIGVLTHGDPSNVDGTNITVQSTTHAQVTAFLKRNRRIRRWNCRDGQCTENGPRDLWWLQPNVDTELEPDVTQPTQPIPNPNPNEAPPPPEEQPIPAPPAPNITDIELTQLKNQIAVLLEDNKQLKQRITKLETSPVVPEKGDKGPQGEKGLKGDVGDTGPEGKQGPIGPPGKVEVVLYVIENGKKTVFKTFEEVVSGSKVNVNLTKIVSESPQTE